MPQLVLVAAPEGSASTNLYSTPALAEKFRFLVQGLPQGIEPTAEENFGCIIGIAVITDWEWSPHAACLRTREHRLVRDMFLSLGTGGIALLWSCVLDAAPFVRPLPHHMRQGKISNAKGLLGQLRHHMLPIVLEQPCIHRGAALRLDALAAHWCERVPGMAGRRLAHDGLFMITLPVQLAHLVAHGLRGS